MGRPKKAVRPWDLCTILAKDDKLWRSDKTKEKGWDGNYWKVNAREETNRREGYFSKVCADDLAANFLSLVIRIVLLG